MSDTRRILAVAAAIAAVTAALYWPVREFAFLNYDDHEYVTENAMVRRGLTAAGVSWALTAAHADNWHPATWVSHMLDVEIFGLDPGAHHLVNAGFHIANTVLLFLLLAGATGALWRSAAVAALFAVHPLHVESVAWVSERKDVLSTLLLLLTCAAYLRYLRRKGAWRYALMCLLFAGGLMAKAMLVTLPFALLLLDYWPLRRGDPDSPWAPVPRGESRIAFLARLVREKGVLIALSLAASAVTFLVQLQGGTVAPLATFPLSARLANALMSYARYLHHAVWPVGLSPSYPYAAASPLALLLAALLLGAVSAFVFRRRERQRHLVTGWLWYLLTLVPVIGLVQVGGMSMADRYTYIPLIGVFIMLSWGLADLAAGWRHGRAALVAAATVALAASVAQARQQLGVWRDSATLAAVMRQGAADEHGIYLDLAAKAAGGGEAEKAIGYYRKAIALRPGSAEARNALGDLLLAQGRAGEAEAEYAAALGAEPENPIAHLNLGNVAFGKGDLERALRHFQAAARRSPSLSVAWNNAGIVLARQGRTAEAIANYTSGLQAEPGNARIHFNLGEALLSVGRTDEAVEHYAEAVRHEPGFAEARARLEQAAKVRGR